MVSPRPLLVRRTDVDKGGRYAGEFAARALPSRFVPGFMVRALGILCFDTRDPVFALTYDDGPDPEHTPGVLDALARHGGSATFFVMTDRAARHPDLIARMIAEGHEVQVHGTDHASLFTRSLRETWREVGAARRELARRGVRATSYRPPYLEFTAAQMMLVAARGMELVLASGDSADWEEDAEAAVVERGARSVFPGAVLLMHDGLADTETSGIAEPTFSRARVAEGVLADAASRGLRAVSLATLSATARPVCARAYRPRQHRARAS